MKLRWLIQASAGGVIVNLCGIARQKIVAALLGVEGLGLVGLATNSFQVLQGLTGFGVGPAVTHLAAREQASSELLRLNSRRLAIFGGVLTCGLALGFPGWFGLSGNSQQLLPGVIVAMVIGVFLANRAAVHRGLLESRSLVGAIALRSAVAALMTLPIALLAYWSFGARVVYYVLAAEALIGYALFRGWRKGIPAGTHAPDSPSDGSQRSGPLGLARTGVAFVLAGQSVSVAVLVVRSSIDASLGGEGLGLFAAAWSLYTAVFGLLMASFGPGYVSSLTRAAADGSPLHDLLLRQVCFVGAVVAPVLVGVAAFGEYLLVLLFSREFTKACTLFQLLVAAAGFQAIAWSLGALVIAAGQKSKMVVQSWAAMGLWVALTTASWGWFGLEGCGLALIVSRIAHAFLTFGMGRSVLRLGPRLACLATCAGLGPAVCVLALQLGCGSHVASIAGISLAAPFWFMSVRRSS